MRNLIETSGDENEGYRRARLVDDENKVVVLMDPTARSFAEQPPPVAAPLAPPGAPLRVAPGAAPSAPSNGELHARMSELLIVQREQQALLAELLREVRALKPQASSSDAPLLVARSLPGSAHAERAQRGRSEPSRAPADEPTDRLRSLRESGGEYDSSQRRAASPTLANRPIAACRRGSHIGAALEVLKGLAARRPAGGARGGALRGGIVTPVASMSAGGAGKRRHMSFLSANHVGEALRGDHNLDDLVSAIERDQQRELERRRALAGGAQPSPSSFLRQCTSAAVRAPHAASPAPRLSAWFGQVPASKRAHASRFVVHPDNRRRARWNALMVAAIVASSITVPLRLAFSVDYEPIMGPVTWTDTVCDVFFALDIVANFFFGYRVADEGGAATTTVVMDHAAVVRHYTRTWLVPDVASTFPFDLVLGADSDAGRLNRSLRLFRIVKLVRVFRMSRALDQLEQRLTALNPAIFRIIKLLLLLLLLWHWTGLIWYTVRFFDQSAVPNLILLHDPAHVPPASSTPAELHISPAQYAQLPAEAQAGARALLASKLLDQYAWLFLWAAAAMSGEILTTPRHWGEAWFTTLVAALGAFLNAAVIGSASSAFSNLDAASARNKERLDKLRAFLRHKRTPASISSRVLSYAEFAWTRSRSENERWLMQELPSTLRLQVMISLQRKLFTRIELFMRLPVAISCSIVSCMKPLICLPGEEIVSTGDGVGLFFITEGTVSVVRHGEYGSSDAKVGELHDGDFFGERSLLGEGEPTNESIIAQSFVSLMVLYATEFRRLREAHPEIASAMAKLRAEQQRVVDVLHAFRKLPPTSSTGQPFYKAPGFIARVLASEGKASACGRSPAPRQGVGDRACGGDEPSDGSLLPSRQRCAATLRYKPPGL
ncbi:hypothetical protein KFE25_004392 [Diacronema lutheri]|uniref:Cyclic nucleotide-binding domain-containing protein n=1 Tax=Diacronema lutheri TaxID=2081491 RepID=A0A8J6C4B0_DIALT|nr:hypothetical protein KFE25_004392 [Diacronema lutheri]